MLHFIDLTHQILHKNIYYVIESLKKTTDKHVILVTKYNVQYGFLIGRNKFVPTLSHIFQVIRVFIGD